MTSSHRGRNPRSQAWASVPSARPVKGGPENSSDMSRWRTFGDWTHYSATVSIGSGAQAGDRRPGGGTVFIRKTVALLAVAAIAAAAAACNASPGGSSAASACKVGVAWATSQEERYKTRDEPAVKAAVEGGGGTYLSGGDAQNKAEIQASQISTLLSSNINVLILNAVDPVAVLPSMQAAIDAGIPVIAYDRELENTKALFLTHDNVLAGHMIAEAVTKVQPTGNYVIIKGDKTQTNPIFLRNGMEEVLKPLVDSGAITIVAEEFTPDWKAENAQTEMENILTA